jgi:hypothetical protein
MILSNRHRRKLQDLVLLLELLRYVRVRPLTLEVLIIISDIPKLLFEHQALMHLMRLSDSKYHR